MKFTFRVTADGFEFLVETKAENRKQASQQIEHLLNEPKRMMVFFLSEEKEELLKPPTKKLNKPQEKPIRKLRLGKKYWLNGEEVVHLATKIGIRSDKDIGAICETSGSNMAHCISNSQRTRAKHINALAEFFEVDPATLVRRNRKKFKRRVYRKSPSKKGKE